MQLVRKVGGHVVGCSFLIRLGFLPGLASLGDVNTNAVLVY
jgi:adenine/guanine phosphoribosyltransferase-like PRPP-binding protein